MKLITLFFDDWKKIDQLAGKPYLLDNAFSKKLFQLPGRLQKVLRASLSPKRQKFSSDR